MDSAALASSAPPAPQWSRFTISMHCRGCICPQDGSKAKRRRLRGG